MNTDKYKTPDGGFKSIGQFLVKVRRACDNETIDPRLVPAQKTTGHLEIGDDSLGGYLIPEQFEREIYESMKLGGAIVRPQALVIPTKTDTVNLPMFNDSSRATNTYGGISFSWPAEAAQMSGSTSISAPAIVQRSLTVHKLVAGCYVSNELEDDHGAFGTVMKAAFGRALSFIEDDYFFQGTGVGQPLGAINSGVTISQDRATVSVLEWQDIVNMAKRLLPASWATAAWYVNPDTLDEIMDTAGTANQAGRLNLGEMRLLGLPIIPTEHCSAMGTFGDIFLADWSHYVIADRSLEIAGSRHTNQTNVGFLSGETYWRVVQRVGGQPATDAAITPKRGANTVSPFVAISTDTS
ncbi:MAG TPA: phage major capsid protein [Dehalococcoidia bacterium]|nr:phage major capsid protein [Dehalococcoidia bacterium]